jgi:ketosteroid isomerase-like protein
MRAFVQSDVDAIVALYAPDATFTGTSSAKYSVCPEYVRAYFIRVLKERAPAKAEVLDHVVQDLGDVAIATVMDRIEWHGGCGPQVSLGRVTFVLRNLHGAWQIVSFHRSEVPGLR